MRWTGRWIAEVTGVDQTESVGSKAQSTKPRMVVFGPGVYGRAIAARAVEKGWPVVAVLNRSGDKVGKDLGRLCGLHDDLGIVVQDINSTDLASIDADIAVVAANDAPRENMPVYRKLMSAGLNVLCIGAQSNYPWATDPETARELDELAKSNNVTFTGGGAWDQCRVWPGILATAACTDLDSVLHRSVTDISAAPAVMYRDGYGGGMTADEFQEKIANSESRFGGAYSTVLYQVLGAIGYTVTGVAESREPIFYDEPIHCPPLDRTLHPGEVGGMRLVGEAQTVEGVTGRMEAEFRLLREAERAHFLWDVDGKPATRVIYERLGGIESLCGYVLNRLTDVIAASPGIQDVSKLGLPRHSSLY